MRPPRLRLDAILTYGSGFAQGRTLDGDAPYTAGNADRLRFCGCESGFTTGYIDDGAEWALSTGSLLEAFEPSAVTVKAEHMCRDLGSRSFAAAGRRDGRRYP